MQSDQKRPKALKKLDTRFRIEWKDGHISEYFYPYLRQMCPCAECSSIRLDGHDVHSLFGPGKAGDVSKIVVSDDIHPLDIQLIGRYAIQFTWSDGHATGIYPFDTLREICPDSQEPPSSTEKND